MIERRRTYQGFWSPRFTDKVFTPYALVIGQSSLAWNYLHEILAEIFNVEFVDPYGYAIWQSLSLDRPKRSLLKAAAKTEVKEVEDKEAHIHFRGEILWILGETEKLEDVRNTIIHSPLSYFGGAMAKSLKKTSGVQPFDLFLHQRASRLAGRNLLAEYRWFRDACHVLTDYAFKLSFLVTNFPDARPWPKRPKLPNRGQKKTRRNQRRQSPPE